VSVQPVGEHDRAQPQRSRANDVEERLQLLLVPGREQGRRVDQAGIATAERIDAAREGVLGGDGAALEPIEPARSRGVLGRISSLDQRDARSQRSLGHPRIPSGPLPGSTIPRRRLFEWSGKVYRRAGRAARMAYCDDAEYRLLLDLMGDLPGKQLLEIGSGPGHWTEELGRLGADVTHIDLEAATVRHAAARAAAHASTGIVADMHALPFADASFDLAFGSMVLHHGSDHARIGRELARVLRPGGLAVFHENSSRNPLLMAARATLTGRFGIPKYGVPDEYPLSPEAIAAIAGAFRSHEVHHGQMVLMQLAARYLARRDRGAVYDVAKRADDWIFRVAPRLHTWSYHQILRFEA
jgi:SAM-dependent methyltransferase